MTATFLYHHSIRPKDFFTEGNVLYLFRFGFIKIYVYTNTDDKTFCWKHENEKDSDAYHVSTKNNPLMFSEDEMSNLEDFVKGIDLSSAESDEDKRKLLLNTVMRLIQNGNKDAVLLSYRVDKIREGSLLNVCISHLVASIYNRINNK